ncbi:glycoside hydrolase family 16 protein [Moniliophthora roreri MCA 2997]|uniref:Glycoside hydrolase family 16 protein n=1 Tax=Moniliophthora roreri (strain MCA 2997) TaxID=1381753 RepID=V2WXR1_MONRO|nr:glycoside hydrolase family 16 protein [Moniliophthora roreri MCA 2997]
MAPPKHGQWSANFQHPQASAYSQPRLNTFSSQNSLNGSPYPTGSIRGTTGPSISDKFSLSPDPKTWGSDVSGKHPEPDDFLHVPDPVRDRKNDQGANIFTSRGLSNVGCLCILVTGIVALFAGYPVISYVSRHDMSFRGGFNLGGINASGQVPEIQGNRGLIDVDTPADAYTFKSMNDGADMQLVFSDEFNKDGRTFYPGDDPYWEAVDIHYWGTNNLEWYDPEAITTANGSLKITMSKKRTHDLDYQGGMMSTWNKFCFTGGTVVARVILPGMSNVPGLWPAIWSMGNLGRAGYGATLEGMWPYTYDACDVGTLKNQTQNGKVESPYLATVDGDAKYGGSLSYLPGQKLSRCTCPGESHPGPVHEDGSYVGRAAPEIDMFEAQVGGNFATDTNPRVGEVSQSGQWAPFNYKYEWFDTPENLIINDPDITVLNGYKGGIFQQATSCVSKTNQKCYSQEPNPCYSIYAFEYRPGYNEGYITWQSDGKQVCTVRGAGLGADTRVDLSARPVPMEPMYLLTNLGMSHNFGDVDFENLVFPVSMYVDYIRVYQRPDSINIGCDPKDFPTKAYIDEYIEAYTNANLTTWRDDYKQPFPKNKLIDQC